MRVQHAAMGGHLKPEELEAYGDDISDLKEDIAALEAKLAEMRSALHAAMATATPTATHAAATPRGA